MVHQILFIIFGLICVAGAINLLAQRHPINSALSLVVVMMALSLIYLLLGAEFVAAVQVIVYAGAIMVLFVFVIMLLNAGEEERSRGSRIALLVGTDFGETHNVARLLFSSFLLPFEITSVLILIAIMGAVVLGKRES